MSIKNSILDLIGNTPLVRVNTSAGSTARILAKLEAFNPTGSVKDRPAFAMIDDARKSGALKDGGTIIEPTSGNTGIGLAMVAAIGGYKLILTMPETMSVERRKILQAYGAQLVLTEGAKGMKGAIEKALELKKDVYPEAFIPQQFENFSNYEMHKRTTGPEIWEDTQGAVDVFIAGVGTGGTISGAGEYLKSKKPSVKVIAVEPSASPVLSGGKPGPHKLQGIGAGFVPKIYNTSVIDEVIQADEKNAGETARTVAKKEGILIGISSGAALWVAYEVAKRPESAGKTIVVILPDTGTRYLSTWLFDEPQTA